MLDPPMGMNWLRMAQAAIMPVLIVAPIVWFCWTRKWLLSATIVGSAGFFLGFIVFGGLEYYDAVAFRTWCQMTNTPCRPSSPSDFTRIVSYGGVAMAQVMALYLAGASVERRLRDREYDRAWR